MLFRFCSLPLLHGIAFACFIQLIIAASDSKRWAVLADGNTAPVAHSLAAEITRRGVACEAIVDDGDAVPAGLAHYVIMLPTTRHHWPTPFSVYNVVSRSGAGDLSEFEVGIVQAATSILDTSTDSLTAVLKATGSTSDRAVFMPVGPVNVRATSPHKWDVLTVCLKDGDDDASNRAHTLYADELTSVKGLRVATAQSIREAWVLLPSSAALVVVPCASDDTNHVALIHAALGAGLRVAAQLSTAFAKDYPDTHAAVHLLSGHPSTDVARFASWLASRQQSNVTSKLGARFTYMVSRFLVGLGAVPPEADDSLPYVDEALIATHALPTFVLSMPELARRDAFAARYKSSFEYVMYDGYTYKKTPFMGSGLSYQRMARLALARGWDRLLIMEDDVVLPPRFNDVLAGILKAIDTDPSWDLFSGMIADVHNDTRVLSLHVCDSNLLVTVDQMTSMVFNVYRTRALVAMSSWNSSNDDFYSNTIDRYMQALGLRTVVRVPYLVGHDSGTTSSIWGLPNSHYDDVIADSERKLQDKARKVFDAVAVGQPHSKGVATSISRRQNGAAKRRRPGGRRG